MQRQLWWWRATLEWRIRRLALRRLAALGLSAPFTWQDYVAALQREFAAHAPHSELRIELVDLGAGDFGRWVITCAPAPAGSIQPARCVEWLSLPSHIADDHLEHIAFHEIGHRELGHLAILHGFTAQPASLTAAAAVADVGQRAISPSRSLPNENEGFTALRDCADASDDEPLRHQAHEREAEVFATLLTRLAHGWDPGALAAPRLEQIFDLLS
ncbi:MAG TPA: hypothetical protein VE338_22455 [Ktedonobacterales bacterium]|jgi:hypothetical protein|nr:hypothetical protein [Ktedonobacterales bacterium]